MYNKKVDSIHRENMIFEGSEQNPQNNKGPNMCL